MRCQAGCLVVVAILAVAAHAATTRHPAAAIAEEEHAEGGVTITHARDILWFARGTGTAACTAQTTAAAGAPRGGIGRSARTPTSSDARRRAVVAGSWAAETSGYNDVMSS